MTLGQGIEVGPFHFTVIRMLIAAGLLRAVIRGEGISGGYNNLDWLVIVWALWALVSSWFHKAPLEALVFRAGLAYNACGIYFLLRILLRDSADVVRLCWITALVLVPIGAAMIYERQAKFNLFSVLGGVSRTPQIRSGSIRCFGPFMHPILAGTVGAVSIPLIAVLWRTKRAAAVAGGAACTAIVYAAASSGPVMTALAALLSMSAWHVREHMVVLRWAFAIAYIVLDIAMKVPAYYILGRIDITGGSTGWHRAELIDSAIRHLDEWWIAGTDYTRHWMPTGVSWSGDHTDITNHYLSMGVTGGLPLMLLFIAAMVLGFVMVGQMVRRRVPAESRFLPWALGSTLFAHAVTSISVSYFDQSFVFIYLTFASISSLWSDAVGRRPSSTLRGTRSAASRHKVRVVHRTRLA